MERRQPHSYPINSLLWLGNYITFLCVFYLNTIFYVFHHFSLPHALCIICLNGIFAILHPFIWHYICICVLIYHEYIYIWRWFPFAPVCISCTLYHFWNSINNIGSRDFPVHLFSVQGWLNICLLLNVFKCPVPLYVSVI